jgi:hypothetical protein
MKYKSENLDPVNQEPSFIYSVIVFSFGIGLLLSGEFAQGVFFACVGIVFYFKYLHDYSRFITQSNDLERKRIISEISAAKGVILLHEARKREMELKLNPSELTNWMLSQKNISDMWQKKIEELEHRLSKIA